MVRLTILSAALIACAGLTACGTQGAERAVASTGPALQLLTPEQETVLRDGVKDNVVYDAVDGGHLAEL